MKDYIDSARIRLLVYDCDGVLTDGRVLVDEEGRESAFFCRGDGYGIQRLRLRGIPQIILSTETSPIAAKRAAKLRILAICAVEDKAERLREYCSSENIPLDNVMYIGNDLNDLPAMQLCGFRGCPKDAEPEVKAICHWVSEKAGGSGVIRDLYRALFGDEALRRLQ